MLKSTLFKHVEINTNASRMGGSFEAQLRRKIQADPDIPSVQDIRDDLWRAVGDVSPDDVSLTYLWYQYLRMHRVTFEYANNKLVIKAADHNTACLISSALVMVTTMDVVAPGKNTGDVHIEDPNNGALVHSGMTLVGLDGFLIVRTAAKLSFYLPDFTRLTGSSGFGWSNHLKFVTDGTVPDMAEGTYVTIDSRGTRTMLNLTTKESTMVESPPVPLEPTPIPPPPVMGASARLAPAPVVYCDKTVVEFKIVGHRFVAGSQADFGSVVVPEPAW